jgi:hypothetical protein
MFLIRSVKGASHGSRCCGGGVGTRLGYVVPGHGRGVGASAWGRVTFDDFAALPGGE